jgi:DNA polymerase-3 subunit delta
MSNYAKNAKKERAPETKNPKMIDEKIKSGKIAGIYCFFGDEEYMIDYYIGKLAGFPADGAGGDDFDRAVFDADNFDIDQFRDMLAGYPVMSEYKTVVVKNTDDIKFKSGEKEELVKILTEHREDILEYCCLIFKAKDLNEKKQTPAAAAAPPFKRGQGNKSRGLSPAAFLKENADLFEFKINPPASLIKWLRKIAAADNIEISAENAGYILNRTENKMYPLKSETDKLIRFAQAEGRAEITKDDIDLLVAKKTETEAFELTNAILDRKYGKAIESLNKLRHLREEPVVVLGQIARHFCDLLPVGMALSSGLTDSFAVSKKTGMHEYKTRLVLNSLKKHEDPGGFIKKSLELCRDCDVKLKSTSLPDYGLIENLLFNISGI